MFKTPVKVNHNNKLNTDELCLVCMKELSGTDSVSCSRCFKRAHSSCLKLPQRETRRNRDAYVCLICTKETLRNKNLTTKSTKEQAPPTELVKVPNPVASNSSGSLSDMFAFLKAFRDDFDAFKSVNTELLVTVGVLGNRVDEMAEQIKCINEVQITVHTRIDEVETQNQKLLHRLQKMEGESNTLNQNKLANNLIITGIDKRDDPDNSFWKLVSVLGANISKDDVSAIILLKSKRGNAKDNLRSPGFVLNTLLVKFCSGKPKSELIEKKKALGVLFSEQLHNTGAAAKSITHLDKTKQAIYFRDHLTTFSMSLFERAKQIQRRGEFKYLWTKASTILMCKASKLKTLRITSHNDLDEIEKTLAHEEELVETQKEVIITTRNLDTNYPNNVNEIGAAAVVTEETSTEIGSVINTDINSKNTSTQIISIDNGLAI